MRVPRNQHDADWLDDAALACFVQSGLKPIAELLRFAISRPA